MKTKIKFIPVVVIILALMLMITACGGTNLGDEKSEDDSFSNPVQEKIDQDEGEYEAYQELVDMRNRAY